jgi:hypothetical protein
MVHDSRRVDVVARFRGIVVVESESILCFFSKSVWREVLRSLYEMIPNKQV